MDGTTYIILVDLPLLALALATICAIAWNRNGGAVSILGKSNPLDVKILGIASMFGLWLLLSVVSIFLTFAVGLVAFYVLLFWVGRLAAGTGAILLTALLVSIPYLWGRALLKSGARR